MKKPRFKVFTKDQLEIMHLGILEILERTGVRMDHKRSLKYLDEMGANVDYKKQIVRFPRELTEEAIKKCPKGKRSRSLENAGRVARGRKGFREEGRIESHTSNCKPYVIDLETDERRLGLVRDVEMMARLTDDLDYITSNSGCIWPQDVAPEIRCLVAAFETLKNTEKANGGFIDHPKQAEWHLKYCAEIAGGVEETRKKPYLASAVVSIVSPLVYGKRALETLWIYGERGLHCGFNSMVSAGSTGPVTLAGAILIQVAEELAGVILLQLIRPGTPATLYPRLSITDLKQGTFSYGSPEAGLMTAALTQLVDTYYDIPLEAAYADSDSKVLDLQVGYDKTFMMLQAVLAGAVSIDGMGGLEYGLSTSPVQLVIDNEIFGMVCRTVRGIEVDEERLALDLIDKVGPGGNFIGERHTHKYLKQDHFLPELTDRRTWHNWKKRGQKNIVDRARETAKKLLATHKPDPIPKDLERRLEAIIKEAEKDLVGKMI